MAMSRKSLKAMGLNDEQVDSVIEMHTETVDGLKEQLKTAEEKVNTLEAVTKERDELKAKVDASADLQAKYDKATAELKKANDDFAAYKDEQAVKEAKAAKTKAARAYVEGKGVTGSNADIAMMALRAEIDGLELDGDKIKDTAALDKQLDGALKGLAVTKGTQGANVAHPPANTGGAMTKEQIMAIKDRAERQKAIAENLELFGGQKKG